MSPLPGNYLMNIWGLQEGDSLILENKEEKNFENESNIGWGCSEQNNDASFF